MNTYSQRKDISAYHRGASGFTLIEVILALGVLAIALPITMALLVTASSSTQKSEFETRASLLARSAFEEIRQALDGQSTIITQTLPWPVFPDENSWIVLYADSTGKIIAQSSTASYRTGVKGPQASYIIAIRGRQDGTISEHAHIPQAAAQNLLARVQVRIESPAHAPENQRQFIEFLNLMPSSSR